MSTTKISSKGQLVLPKDIREAKAWGVGTVLRVEATNDGVLLRTVPTHTMSRLKDVAGSLWRPGQKRITEEAIAEGIARAIKGRHARGRY